MLNQMRSFRLFWWLVSGLLLSLNEVMAADSTDYCEILPPTPRSEQAARPLHKYQGRVERIDRGCVYIHGRFHPIDPTVEGTIWCELSYSWLLDLNVGDFIEFRHAKQCYDIRVLQRAKSRKKEYSIDKPSITETQGLSRDEYIKHVARRISASFRYPTRARRNNQEGRVVVKFTIGKGGELLTAELIDKSGFSVIDQDALETVQRASPFGKLPKDINEERLPLMLPIIYKLK
jgi:TonB family protein